MKKIKIALIILAIILIAGLLVWKFYVQKPVTSVRSTKADYTITAQDLFKEAIANDSATKNKYIDKVVAIKGMVKEIFPSDSASVVNLGDSTSEDVVKCQIFAKDNEKVKNIKAQQIVTIKGRLTGFNIQVANPDDLLSTVGSSIEMKDCALEQ